MDIQNQQDFYDNLWTHSQKLNSLKLRRAIKILEFFTIIKRQKSLPKVLDLGCGEGRFIAFIGEFADAYGIDLSEKSINHAKTLYPNTTYFQGNVLTHDFGKEKYDLIISQEVIEHIENQELYINICYSILNPGGYLILTTPNKRVLNHMVNGKSWSNQPIENVLLPKQLKRLVSIKFKIVKYDSIVLNFGHLGYFKVLNSKYIIGAFNKLNLKGFREFILGKFGFGLHQCILAIKND